MTSQTEIWNGKFGVDYTKRNKMSIEKMDALYQDRYWVTRSAMNEDFLDGLGRKMRILEVGCNIGNQLKLLQTMGFTELYGIELQQSAVELAKKNTQGISIICGSAAELPFKDAFFDMVFTSGVLIHIPPANLPKVMDEIYRCSKKYIWGFEYYSPSIMEVPYRGNAELLWKADFAKIYLNRFPNLQISAEERYGYKDESGNIDTMFLLVK